MALLDILGGAFTEPVECKVFAGGQEISDLYPHLAEITVNMSRRIFTEATLKFESPADETGTRVVGDREDLVPWTDLKIEVFFGPRSETLFDGVIYKATPSFPGNSGEAAFTLTCRDQAAKMSRLDRMHKFGEKTPTTDQAILAEILSRYGLSPHPDNDPGMNGVVLNTRESDISFLQNRARDNGFDLIFFHDSVYFGPPMVQAATQTPILVYAGKKSNCYSFNIENLGENFEKVALTGRDEDGNPETEEIIEPNLPLMGDRPARSSGNGLEKHQAFVADSSSPNPDVQRRRAQGQVNEQSLSIKATGELDGTTYGHVLVAGKPVIVDGVGDLYSGPYLVDSVTHKINRQGYRQNFELLRNALGYTGAEGSLGAALEGVI